MWAVAAALTLIVSFAARRRAALAPQPVYAIAAVRRDVPVAPVPAAVPGTGHPAEAVPVAVQRLHRKPRMPRRSPAETGADAVIATPFVAIPYVEPVAPSDQLDVYSVQLPRASLIVYGVPVRAGSLDSPVLADIAVGSNGVVRAVRFVN